MTNEAIVVSSSLKSARVDVKGLTIDGPFSQDLDDALWAEQLPDGNTRLTVSIADVADAIDPGCAADLQAREMGTSIYFASGVKTMLPRHLSFGRLSLLPHQKRKVVVIRATLDPQFRLVDSEVALGRLRSAVRLSYAEAEALAHGMPHAHTAQLQLLARIADSLLARRRGAGAMAIYDLKNGWATGEDGQLVRLDSTRRHIGYVIVQEAMILTNHILARWLAERNLTVPFRVHQTIDDAEVLRFAGQVKELLAMGNEQAILAFQSRWAAKLKKAEYAPVSGRHFGLGLPEYVHGTSPIRRYADLLVQRAIRSQFGRGEAPAAEFVQEMCVHLTEVDHRRRQSKAAGLKAINEEQARENADPRRAAVLSPAEFRRMLEVACRDGRLAPALGEEFIRRFVSGGMTHRDYFALLFDTAVDGLSDEGILVRQRLLEMIMGAMHVNPSQAVMLLYEAQSNQKLAGILVEAPQPIKGSQPPRFVCTIRREDVSVVQAEAGNKQMARARACLQFIAEYVGVSLAQWDEPSTSAAPAAPPATPTSDPATNPIGYLQESAQLANQDLPEYRDRPTKGGFSCTVRFDGLVSEGQGKTKKEAKRTAAAHMVEAIARRQHSQENTTDG